MDWHVPEIPALCAQSRVAAHDRQNDLTKPPGSLGRLENLATRLAAMQARSRPRIDDPVVIVFAADHGVVVHGVSPCRAEVTAQQTVNFGHGRGAVGVLAKLIGARLEVVDVGVDADLPSAPRLLDRKIARGTADLTQGPAMSLAQCQQALAVGCERVAALAPMDCLVVGEMGIGNTTPSAAMMAAFLGLSPERCCGRGAGLDDAGVSRKAATVARALAANADLGDDPMAILAALGGLEIAAMTGAMLAAASARIPVVVDGFIASAAALAATRLEPRARDYLVFGHRGAEQGHRLLLEALEADPLLELELRLGEGTGAELAVPLLRAACCLLDELTTWDEAGVVRQDGC
ncbi:MAG: nicotinate-nucleotide--dimethylbenzimidazole phosphoribosyltransferase [Planctomycetota bacterium]|jgi:nicotinate-nucleotide--dimethylbenzimidazole phosphoribosyltransferase|nr:nicotinate-nucleotide--dimethylbenzimidazole phosphoribosyltransferase [Planctomycetota bacterium]